MGTPVGLCLECAKGSTVLKGERIMAFGECMLCGKTSDCLRGDCIGAIFPYVPLHWPSLEYKDPQNRPLIARPTVRVGPNTPTSSFPNGAPQGADYASDKSYTLAVEKYNQEWCVSGQCPKCGKAHSALLHEGVNCTE